MTPVFQAIPRGIVPIADWPGTTLVATHNRCINSPSLVTWWDTARVRFDRSWGASESLSYWPLNPYPAIPSDHLPDPSKNSLNVSLFPTQNLKFSVEYRTPSRNSQTFRTVVALDKIIENFFPLFSSFRPVDRSIRNTRTLLVFSRRILQSSNL